MVDREAKFQIVRRLQWFSSGSLSPANNLQGNQQKLEQANMNNNRSTYENEVASVEISGRRLLPLRNGKRQHVVEIDLFNAEGERVNRLTLFGVDGDKIKIKRNKTRYIK